jgi:putative tricarboxylic transport membrane protein
MARLVTPLILVIAGITYLFLTFDLTKSRVGDPNGPMYFPLIIGILLVIFSLIYLVQEWMKRGEKFEALKELFTGRTSFLMVSTLILMFVYTFLFERIGFLYTTMIVLTILLFIINGKKRWIQNILISVIFSFVSWYAFSELLSVSLP